MVSIFSGRSVRSFTETGQNFKEHAESAAVVFRDFGCFLHVLQAGLGIKKIAPQGFIFKK